MGSVAGSQVSRSGVLDFIGPGMVFMSAFEISRVDRGLRIV